MRERSLGLVGWAAAATVSLVATLTILRAIPSSGVDAIAYREHTLPAAVLAGGLVAVAATTLAVWASAARHPWAAVGLGLAESAALLPLAAAWPEVPAGLAPWLLATTCVVPAGLLLVVTGWARGPALPAAVLRVVVVVVLMAYGVAALAYDPFADVGCARTCTRAPAPMSGVVSSHTAVTVTASLTLVAALVALAAVTATMTPSIARRPLLAGGALSLAATVAVETAHLTASGDRSASAVVLLVRTLVPALLAGLVGAELVRERRRRRRLEDVVDALSRSETLGKGPVVAADFATHDGNGWLDASGRPVSGADIPGAVVLADDGVPTVRLHLARGARPDDVLADLTPATRLALRNAQLAASLRRRVVEVQESQSRVVEVSDRERTRIERDLHDGAQQRLVGVAFHLRLARGEADTSTALLLATAEETVLDVLAHLRRLSHGTLPAVLADEGLQAALDELVDEAPGRVRADVDVLGDVPAAVARAAYVVVADVLGAAGPRSSAVVDVSRVNGAVRVNVGLSDLDGPVEDETLIQAADRVGALGGRWRVRQHPGRLEVEAEVPCGS